METDCNSVSFEFQPLASRQITARFDGGTITSDAGGLLLREVEARSGLLARLATCFDDHRDPEKIEHTVEELLKQRVFALALGYEDLNDHDQLRPADIDAAAGSVKQVARIVEHIRRRWPHVRIILRGDSGFCRENLMRWCEENRVDYVFGLPKNRRLTRIIGKELHEAKLASEASGQAARVFKDFVYRTHKSWSRERRVVGKAEHLAKGANPRFVVTSLAAEREPAQLLYEKRYCARGEMENRIKEQQLYLFADRTSCGSMRANQLRLWLSSAAYVMLAALRQHGLKGTSLAQARCDTIRLKLLKIGSVVRVTVRRVWSSLAASCPYQALFAQVFANLAAWRPLPPTAVPA